MLKLLVDDLKLNINKTKIDYVKRLGKKSDQTRPMLIKFNNFRY